MYIVTLNRGRVRFIYFITGFVDLSFELRKFLNCVTHTQIESEFFMSYK